MVVSTIMRLNPICIFENDTIGHAAELMLDNEIGDLPVTNREQRLVGMLTESNLFQPLAQRWRDDNLIFSGATSRD